MFYESAPPCWLSFASIFLMRRTLIELMHADLIAIRAGLGQLDSLDVQGHRLPIVRPVQRPSRSHVRQVADEWKQPFQQEYTERTVNQAFEKLLGSATDVKKRWKRFAPKSLRKR